MNSLILAKRSIARVLHQIWPTLLSEARLNPEQVFEAYEQACGRLDNRYNDISPQLLELARYLFDEEDSRRQRLETTAANLLNGLGVVAALVVGVSGVLLTQETANDKSILIGIVGVYSGSLLYLSAAFLLSLGVFSHEPRYYLDPSDLVPTEPIDQQAFELSMARRLMKYTIENYKINNRQVNRLRTVRVLFRNAVLVILVAGLLLGLSVVGKAEGSKEPMESRSAPHSQ